MTTTTNKPASQRAGAMDDVWYDLPSLIADQYGTVIGRGRDLNDAALDALYRISDDELHRRAAYAGHKPTRTRYTDAELHRAVECVIAAERCATVRTERRHIAAAEREQREAGGDYDSD